MFFICPPNSPSVLIATPPPPPPPPPLHSSCILRSRSNFLCSCPALIDQIFSFDFPSDWSKSFLCLCPLLIGQLICLRSEQRKPQKEPILLSKSQVREKFDALYFLYLILEMVYNLACVYRVMNARG